jgi:hypothetical protein
MRQSVAACRQIGGYRSAVDSPATMCVMSRAIHELQKLRDLRARPVRDTSIAGIVAQAATEATRAHRKLGEVIMVWEQCVPAELARETVIISIGRGVLHVAVSSSSVMYELDRMLRGGLTDTLRRTYRGSLTRVKLRLHDAPARKKRTR